VQSDGTVTRLEEQKRTDARDRQAVARDVLDGLEVIGHPSSYFLWLPLPGEARADQVAAALMRETISVSTAEPFTTTKNPPHAIRLALPANDDVPMRLLRIGRPCPNKIVFVAPLSCNSGRVVATRCGKTPKFPAAQVIRVRHGDAVRLPFADAGDVDDLVPEHVVGSEIVQHSIVEDGRSAPACGPAFLARSPKEHLLL
jgi:hypothetical protein